MLGGPRGRARLRAARTRTLADHGRALGRGDRRGRPRPANAWSPWRAGSTDAPWEMRALVGLRGPDPRRHRGRDGDGPRGRHPGDRGDRRPSRGRPPRSLERQGSRRTTWPPARSSRPGITSGSAREPRPVRTSSLARRRRRSCGSGSAQPARAAPRRGGAGRWRERRTGAPRGGGCRRGHGIRGRPLPGKPPTSCVGRRLVRHPHVRPRRRTPDRRQRPERDSVLVADSTLRAPLLGLSLLIPDRHRSADPPGPPADPDPLGWSSSSTCPAPSPTNARRLNPGLMRRPPRRVDRPLLDNGHARPHRPRPGPSRRSRRSP